MKGESEREWDEGRVVCVREGGRERRYKDEVRVKE